MKKWDCLKILTKDEIIEFLNTEYFCRAPDERQIIFFKYMRKEKELYEEMQKHLDNPDQQMLAKEIDLLSAKFNSSTDTEEKLEILEEREKLTKLFWKHEEEYQSISARQESNKKKYEDAMKKVRQKKIIFGG